MIMGSDAGVAAALLEAVPRWPFISADGQTGGFVRPGSLQPVDPDRHEASGVFAGALTGAPRRIACPAPSVPPVFDNPARRPFFLAHDDGDQTSLYGRPAGSAAPAAGAAVRSSRIRSATGLGRSLGQAAGAGRRAGVRHGGGLVGPTQSAAAGRSGNLTRARPGPSSSGRWMSNWRPHRCSAGRAAMRSPVRSTTPSCWRALVKFRIGLRPRDFVGPNRRVGPRLGGQHHGLGFVRAVANRNPGTAASDPAGRPTGLVPVVWARKRCRAGLSKTGSGPGRQSAGRSGQRPGEYAGCLVPVAAARADEPAGLAVGGDEWPARNRFKECCGYSGI